jgi:hypothetical protein
MRLAHLLGGEIGYTVADDFSAEGIGVLKNPVAGPA